MVSSINSFFSSSYASANIAALFKALPAGDANAAASATPLVSLTRSDLAAFQRSAQASVATLNAILDAADAPLAGKISLNMTVGAYLENSWGQAGSQPASGGVSVHSGSSYHSRHALTPSDWLDQFANTDTEQRATDATAVGAYAEASSSPVRLFAGDHTRTMADISFGEKTGLAASGTSVQALLKATADYSGNMRQSTSLTAEAYNANSGRQAAAPVPDGSSDGLPAKNWNASAAISFQQSSAGGPIQASLDAAADNATSAHLSVSVVPGATPGNAGGLGARANGERAPGTGEAHAYTWTGRQSWGLITENFAGQYETSNAEVNLYAHVRKHPNGTVSLSSHASITTGNGDDRITVSSSTAVTASGLHHASTRIDSGAGNDVIETDGQTFLDSGTGDDRISVGEWSRVDAGEGNDVVSTTDGSKINAGAGDDSIVGRDKMELLAGAGNDKIRAGRNGDIHAGDGNDLVIAGGSIVKGGAGNDTLIGAPSSPDEEEQHVRNTLDGGDGDDYIQTAGGIAIGGTGNDTIRLTGDSTWVRFNRGDGRDTVISRNNFTLQLRGYSQGDVTVTEKDGNMLVSFQGTDDSLTLNLSSGATAHLRFEDGSTMDVQGASDYRPLQQAVVQTYLTDGGFSATDPASSGPSPFDYTMTTE